MPIDEALLRNATEARHRADELNQEAARARFAFHQAVCDLHRAGGSLREIAEALDLSHQRVHQIVESGQGAGPRGAWSRLLGRRSARQGAGAISVSCSFCGRGQHTVHRLIAGPGTYICDTCVALARRVLDAGAAQAGEHTTLEPAADDARCNFCGQGPRHHRGQVVGRGDRHICASCLSLCEEVVRG